MKLNRWIEIIFAVLLFFLLALPAAYPMPHTVFQCRTADAFIVYYFKDGKIYSIVGSTDHAYLACQGQNCNTDSAKIAEYVILGDAKIQNTVRQVDLDTVCQ